MKKHPVLEAQNPDVTQLLFIDLFHEQDERCTNRHDTAHTRESALIKIVILTAGYLAAVQGLGIPKHRIAFPNARKY